MPSPSIAQYLPYLEATGGALQVFGLFERGKSARLAGERARLAAEFTAWQAEEQGKLAIAISQRRALEERRQGDVLASRALAVAAASGGSVNDPTIINLLSRTKGEAAYAAQVALYEGEAQARELRLHGAASRVGGSQAVIEGIRSQTGYKLGAAGQALRTGAEFYRNREDSSSLYDKYGGGGPSGDSGLIEETPNYGYGG